MATKKQRRRSGAAAVEFAVVAPVVFMFIFGIFEYCRYGFLRQVMENAVREGARYAVVNTNSTLTPANATIAVQNVVILKLLGVPNGTGGGTGGLRAQLGSPVVTVVKINPATGQWEDGAVPANVVVPSPAQPPYTNASQAPYVNAGFGDAVSVTLNANYLAVIGNFVNMPTSIPIQATSVMMSEGN